MEKKKLAENRRDFLTKVISLAAMACLGCKHSAAQQLTPDIKNKVAEQLGMTAEETYSFFYGLFIPILQSLSKEMGSEKFNTFLLNVSKENTAQMIASITKDLTEKDLKAFSTFFQELIATPPYNSALTYEVVEQTDKVVEFMFTECLPAKVLRAMNAIDIGLALECSGGEAVAKAFNPNIKYSNPKNLMKGDSVCIERYTLGT